MKLVTENPDDHWFVKKKKKKKEVTDYSPLTAASRCFGMKNDD